jgi:AraC family transcriptional regulator, positive regulator of tynA and feaB
MDANSNHDTQVDLESSRCKFDDWREWFQSTCGRYNPEGIQPTAFTGWARPGSAFGFMTVNLGSNVSVMRRTHRDVRLDGVDQYLVVFHVSGRTKFVDHNDQAARFVPGSVVLVDGARPLSCIAEGNGDMWNAVAITLPRKGLASHVGFDPKGGLCRSSATPAARLLLDLIQNTGRDEGSAFSPGNAYMQLVIYDLVGALFAPSDAGPISRQTDKLFERILGVIKNNFADPSFGPAQTAAKSGISLRYLHKLFCERGLTCREFIYSRRLDYAAHLLRRRASLAPGKPLSGIAYACGFEDYAHFARKFRHRYGQPPGAYASESNDVTQR